MLDGLFSWKKYNSDNILTDDFTSNTPLQNRTQIQAAAVPACSASNSYSWQEKHTKYKELKCIHSFLVQQMKLHIKWKKL